MQIKIGPGPRISLGAQIHNDLRTSIADRVGLLYHRCQVLRPINCAQIASTRPAVWHINPPFDLRSKPGNSAVAHLLA